MNEGAFEETFPLSGGFTPGMELTIKAKVMTPLATIDFLTPLRKVGFRFAVDSVAQEIIRSSGTKDSFASSQAWGAYPFDSGAVDVELKFLKTQHSWGVTVNGVRSPWFDYRAGDDLITHAKFVGSWDDVEVVQRRPTCTQECDKSECLASGKLCDGGACYSTVAGETCFADTDTLKNVDSHCCENRQTSVDLNTVNVGDFLRVHERQNILTSTCDSYGLGDDCKDAILLQSKVKVVAVDKERDILIVFSVARYAERKQPYEVHLPSPVLQDSPVESAFFDITREEMKMVEYDRPTGLLLKVSGSAVNEGLTKQKYVNIMTTHKGLAEWYQYTPDRWGYVSNRDAFEKDDQMVHVVLTDGLVSTLNCTDVGGTTWTDKSGNTCAAYEEGSWCTSLGVSTNAYNIRYPSPGGLYNNLNDGDKSSAPWNCCVCGGGLRDVPEVVPDAESTARAPLLFK